MLTELFKTIDHKDTEGFLSFLAEDCVFRFGNIPAVQGTDNIREFVGGFFDSIAGLSHQIQESWATPEGEVCHGQVTYTRHDGSQLCVPYAVMLKESGSRIAEYLIFADTSQLYNH